jgi:hypothetical protein
MVDLRKNRTASALKPGSLLDGVRGSAASFENQQTLQEAQIFGLLLADRVVIDGDLPLGFADPEIVKTEERNRGR